MHRGVLCPCPFPPPTPSSPSQPTLAFERETDQVLMQHPLYPCFSYLPAGKKTWYVIDIRITKLKNPLRLLPATALALSLLSQCEGRGQREARFLSLSVTFCFLSSCCHHHCFCCHLLQQKAQQRWCILGPTSSSIFSLAFCLSMEEE